MKIIFVMAIILIGVGCISIADGNLAMDFVGGILIGIGIWNFGYALKEFD